MLLFFGDTWDDSTNRFGNSLSVPGHLVPFRYIRRYSESLTIVCWCVISVWKRYLFQKVGISKASKGVLNPQVCKRIQTKYSLLWIKTMHFLNHTWNTITLNSHFNKINLYCNTVDGQNPAPPGMVKTLINNGIIIILGGAGFCPSTVFETFV